MGQALSRVAYVSCSHMETSIPTKLLARWDLEAGTALAGAGAMLAGPGAMMATCEFLT